MNITAFFMGMVYYCLLPYVFIPLNHMVQQDQDNISLNVLLPGTATRFLEYSPIPFVNMARKRWIVIFSVVLIIWGQYEQCKHHALLAELRKNRTEKEMAPRSAYISKYRLPQGRWFHFISSPHYLSEILIYVGLITLLKCSSSQNLQESFNSLSSPVRYIDPGCSFLSYTQKILLCSSSSGFKACALMSWIVTNLSISAHRNHKWYQHEFLDYPGNPMMKRKALIPFIW
jgi:3-oxo-5-alpha-steroid 4-dehydrogenase 3